MRSMLRRLFTILSALSLLLCVATAALWVRSYWIADRRAVVSFEPPVLMWSSEGTLGINNDPEVAPVANLHSTCLSRIEDLEIVFEQVRFAEASNQQRETKGQVRELLYAYKQRLSSLPPIPD